MREKLIANWLDNASERSFQVPFCQMLQAQGHTLLHLTRHCAMELGTDVITIAPNGVPCAYQLKTAKSDRINLKTWRDEIAPQIDDLVSLSLNHPSLPPEQRHHQSYFVTNKDLDETVWEWIRRKNEGWSKQGTKYKLDTVVRGELYRLAMDSSDSCWPSELGDLRVLLELHLDDGKGILPKSKLARLLESIHENSTNREDAKRACASTPLLVSVAIQNYTERENHIAEIEAWIMAIAYMFWQVERSGLETRQWKNSFDLMWMALENAFERLLDELMRRLHHAEGDPFGEPELRGGRFTILAGFLSAYGLKKNVNGYSRRDRDKFLFEWVSKHSSKMLLWGESSIPFFLSRLWFLKEYNRHFLASLIYALSTRNHPKSEHALASPYKELEEIILRDLKSKGDPTSSQPRREGGNAWMLEGLVYLYVRLNWKQTMKFLWPGVTHIAQWSFAPKQAHDFFKWRTDDGTTHQAIPERLQHWEGLKAESWKTDDGWVPEVVHDDPAILLMILLVYPHRMNSKCMRWLDTAFNT